MKRLLLPFLALALCPPAHADKATFDLAELPPLPSLDTTGRPALAPPTKPSTARIRRGDSLAAFLRRHGVTEEQLKRFNPGVQLNQLTLGTELHILDAGSGQSAITPERQYVINRLNANRQQEVLRWRNFGGIYYDWNGWKRSSNGTRITTMRFSLSSYRRSYLVAVTCKGLKVSHKSDGVWTKWKMPNAGEEQMLIELCSQIPGAPKAAVRTAPQPKAKPCTGSRIECASRL